MVSRSSTRRGAERPTHELDEQATETSENDESDEISKRRSEWRSDVVCEIGERRSTRMLRERDAPGLILNFRHSTTSAHMKLPSTALLMLAASILTHSTNSASKYPPRMVYVAALSGSAGL